MVGKVILFDSGRLLDSTERLYFNTAPEMASNLVRKVGGGCRSQWLEDVNEEVIA